MSTTPNEREAFEAHIKTTAWYQVLSASKDEDDDGASVFRMARMAADAAWQARSSLPPSDHIGDGNKMVGVSAALISKLTVASVVIGNLPQLPGYNGSILTIDDTEAEKIASDLDEVCAALAAAGAKSSLLEAAKDVLDTELGELACTGSSAPAEHALGRLRDAVAGAKPEPEGEAVKLVLPEMPDLRFHGEYRRGYANALSDVQALNSTTTVPTPAEENGQGEAVAEVTFVNDDYPWNIDVRWLLSVPEIKDCDIKAGDKLYLAPIPIPVPDSGRAEAQPAEQVGEPTDEQIRKVYQDACEHADELQQGFSYGRMQALRAVFNMGRRQTR